MAVSIFLKKKKIIIFLLHKYWKWIVFWSMVYNIMHCILLYTLILNIFLSCTLFALFFFCTINFNTSTYFILQVYSFFISASTFFFFYFQRERVIMKTCPLSFFAIFAFNGRIAQHRLSLKCYNISRKYINFLTRIKKWINIKLIFFQSNTFSSL